MEKLTVKELATLAGVSVRTLHHYDRIGLLKPGQRSDALYRFYGKEELIRLQQVLLYKELGFPLAEIKEILDNPRFNLLEALKNHKSELQKRKDRMDELLQTVDNTIHQLTNKNEKMDYTELYKGFTKDQAEAYETEAKQRWGIDTVEESKQRVLQMSKADWAAIKEEMENISRELATLMHLSLDDQKVQGQIKRHWNWVGNFYTVTPQVYSGLAFMYVDDDRFKANYEKHAPGLASFMSRAMLKYVERMGD